MKKFKLIAKTDNERIDKYIANELPEFSRSQISKLIDEGKVFVNNKPIKASYKLNSGDIINFTYEVKNIELIAQDINLDIVYEDKYLFIVNKAEGMVVHPGDKNQSQTLVNAILYHYDKLANMEDPIRPGIVHRLDKDTSGLMVCVKDDEAYKRLIEMFKTHAVRRKYLAIVKGLVNKEGTINKPLARDPKNRLRMAENHKNGKPAITHYKPIIQNNVASLLDIELETGRMHQIRAHMRSIHRPIIGDNLYGFDNFNAKRMYLHSYYIEFMHPITNEQIKIETDIPKSFKQFMKKVGMIE